MMTGRDIENKKKQTKISFYLVFIYMKIVEFFFFELPSNLSQ